MSRRKRRFSPHAAAPKAAPCAPSQQGRPVPPPRLSLHPDAGGGIAAGVPLTPDEVRRLYGPPRTLGASEETRLALDSQLADGGVYTLLQHTFQLGQAAAPQFMGYGALQNMAQNGLLRACIETVADDMTREWITLRGGDAPHAGDASDRLKRLEEALRRFNLQAVFHEAAELVGYEGGAFVFIDTGADGARLMGPLHLGAAGAELAPGRPLRFTVIDPVNVFPGDYNSTSPLREDYFRPRWWWVLGERVHASRLIRLVANEVPILLRPAYNFMGIPQAQILWDYILHFQECRTAEARLLKKFSMTVFKTTMQDIILSAEGTAQLDRRVRYMIQTMSNDGVLAVDKDTEDVVKLETPLSGVTDIVRQALEFLAALNRTPAVKLLGISPSGFNATGESDIRNYYDHITSQQEKVLRAGIWRALTCIQLHEFRDIDRGLDFDFAPLGEEDRAALATQQKTRADTVAVYLDRGVISTEEARGALARDPDSPFADIDPEELPEGAEGVGDMPPGMEGEPGDPGDVDDVDKAGAVYDGALDAEKWCTTSKGKHFQVETETGEILKGNIGQGDDHFGPAYSGFKGKPHEAIEHLLKEKNGHVPGAFHKEGLGDIDLPYGKGGKDGFGLAHIIERRNEQNQDGEAFVRNLPSLIQEGKVEYRKEFPGRAYVVHEKRAAVIRLDWDGQERKWMVTAYPLEKKISGAQDGCRTCVLTFDDRQSFPLPYAGVQPAKQQEEKKKVASGGHGKFSQDTCLRKPGLVFSRPDLGAETAFTKKVNLISRDVKLGAGAASGMEGQA